MYAFEGEFRRRPTQALGGANRADNSSRDQLLREKQQERRQREIERQKAENSKKIQALVRGFLTRRRIAKKFRADVDTALKNGLNENSFGVVIAKLVAFYDPSKDEHRLETTSQYLLSKQAVAIKNIEKGGPKLWTRKLRYLLMANLRVLQSNPRASLVLPLRLVDIYANVCGPALWEQLVDAGYFSVIKHLIVTRVPEVDEDCLRAPTTLGESLLMFIRKPLEVCTDRSVKVLVVRKMLEEMFNEQYADSLDCRLYHMVLPILASLDGNVLSSSEIVESAKIQERPATVWKSAALARIMSPRISRMSTGDLIDYLSIIKKNLLGAFEAPKNNKRDRRVSDSETEDENDEEEMDIENEVFVLRRAAIESFRSSLNEEHFVQRVIDCIESTQSVEAMIALSSIIYVMQTTLKHAIHTCPLIHKMAFRPSLIRLLWNKISTFEQRTVNQRTPFANQSPETRLIKLLASGRRLSQTDTLDFLPLLTAFCNLFGHLLPTIYETEFYHEMDVLSDGSRAHEPKRDMMPFSLMELSQIAVQLREIALGLIDLSFPESQTSTTTRESYEPTNAELWLGTFHSVVQFSRQLYSRDSRRKFCDKWMVPLPIVPGLVLDERLQVPFVERKPFLHMEHRRYELNEDFLKKSNSDLRNITILQELPFVVSFQTRVKILRSLLEKEISTNRQRVPQLPGFQPASWLNIRRNYIYEDAFEKLTEATGPDIKGHVRVAMTNAVGLEEAGLDGGGIFREFLQQLLKTSFDINRGFFKTTSDNLLYPNPGVHLIVPKFQDHYYFIGRMLGKALFEGMLVELPMAGFFLSKLLARTSVDLDIHHLASLDPTLNKNLLYLKTYNGDVSELGLDFSISLNELGQQQVIELKPNGQLIPVTNANRIEYIHLMADFKLNKQIRQQTSAFKQGLASVINPHWLKLFDANELQVLISGVSTPIDLDDWRMNTAYGNGYDDKHPVIRSFWEVIKSFEETQRQDLLKFCTSCSRPPFFGFKELQPSFCINRVESTDRLPTSATCMNLLKLPDISDFELLKHKLLTAIQANAGFELS